MAEYIIQDSTLTGIADAIRAKTGGSAAMTPAQMATEIGSISGGSSITVEPLTVTQNGTTTAPSGKAYSPVTVNVPNSYTNSDEGKVVSGGSLVDQTFLLIEHGGTHDTTTVNNVFVDISPTTLLTIEDKLNSLTSNISSDLFDGLRTNLPAFGDLSAKLTAAVKYNFMGVRVLLNLFNYGSYNNENVIAGMAFDTDGSLNGTVGAVLMWSANSGLIRADVLMNGQLQDLLSYASQIDAVLVVSGVAD